MMKTKGLILTVVSLVTILFMISCEDNSTEQPGSLVVKVTDAPFPIDLVEEANVIITRVEIRTTADSAYPFTTIFEGSQEFNLMELRNGIAETLVDTVMPAGEYDLIRVYVDSASIVVTEQGTFDVKVPSGAQTGIKLFIEPALRVYDGLDAEVLLDFSLDESFVIQGNMNSPAGIKGFIFKPVIRAVNNTKSGAVEGVVMDTASVLLENAAVWIELEDDTLTSYTDDQGYYAITGIPSGDYIMGAALVNYDTVTMAGVEIVEGNLTVQDFTLEETIEEEE